MHTENSTMMNADRRKRLEAIGWKLGSVAEFLNLTAEEEALIESEPTLQEWSLSNCSAKGDGDDD